MLLCCGNFFASMQATGMVARPMGVGEEVAPLCSICAIAIPLCNSVLYSMHVGVSVEGFRSSLRAKLRLYGYLYLHMPLTACIQGISIVLYKVDCPVNEWRGSEGNTSLVTAVEAGVRRTAPVLLRHNTKNASRIP